MNYNVSPEEFLTDFKKNQVCCLDRRKIVYIDMLHWINMRKAVIENANFAYSETYIEIYNILFSLVNNRIVVCPNSYIINSELEKQDDLNSLMSTCRLIDNLSCNISFNFKLIMGSELIQLSNTCDLIKNGYDYRFCPIVCSDMDFFINDILSILKQKNDSNYKINSELITFLNMSTSGYFIYKRKYCATKIKHNTGLFAEILQQNKTTTINFNDALVLNSKSVIKSLVEIYSSIKEIKENTFNGVLEANQSTIRNFSKAIFYVSQILTIKQLNIQENALKNKRENDFYDLYHSSIALAYSNYFFTEKSFHHLLTNKPFENTGNCIVESNPSMILLRLQELQNQRSNS